MENRMETTHLLAVSREPAVLRLLWSVAESNAWHLETAASGWDVMERVQSGSTPRLLLLDLPRGDSDSLHLLRWLRRLRPELSVAVLCSDDGAAGKEATRLGAEDVLVAPFNEQQIELVIRRHLVPIGNTRAVVSRENFDTIGADGFFVSASPMMHKLRAQAELLAQADVPVLILGEPGSGKYTVASLIHKLSVRSGFRLCKVNCAEMPETLLEAELFGEKSIASDNNRPTSLGKFAAGEKGTIFLSEITEMPARLQSRLLQVLQSQGLKNQGLQNAGVQNPILQNRATQDHRGLPDHGFHSDDFRSEIFPNHGVQNPDLRRTAGADGIPADVRILATSSVNLDRALAERRLREDLYYRLSAFTVQVPPLRQRRDEIAILLRYLMHKLAKHYNLPARGFSSSMLDACRKYSWPGNLAELETFVKRYLVAGEPQLTLGEMSLDSIDREGRIAARNMRPAATAWGETEDGRDIEIDEESELRQEAEPESLKSLIQGIKSEAEQNAIGAALKKTGWNRKAAARLLRVSYRTLLYKIEQYHMRAPDAYLPSLPIEEFSVQADGVKGNGKAS
jgi:two-component system, NtrC family, response regulator AtoC